MLTYFNVLYPLPVTSTEQVLFLEATSAWVCGSMSLFVPKMVRLTSSKDQNVCCASHCRFFLFNIVYSFLHFCNLLSSKPCAGHFLL